MWHEDEDGVCEIKMGMRCTQLGRGSGWGWG